MTTYNGRTAFRKRGHHSSAANRVHTIQAPAGNGVTLRYFIFMGTLLAMVVDLPPGAPSVIMNLGKHCPHLLDEEAVGFPTDLCPHPIDTGALLVTTSKGFFIHLSINKVSGVVQENSRVRVTKNQISKFIVLEDQCTLFATNSGKLRILKNGIISSVRCETNLGDIGALAAAGGRVYVGNDSGDVHIGKIEGRKLIVSKTLDHHDDFISALLVISVKKTILVASGDGCVSVVDLKKEKVVARSSNYEEDLTCLLALPDESHFVVASSGGCLRKFKWNYWGAPVDTIKSKMFGDASINSLNLLRISGLSEDFIISADGEGSIRILSSSPLSTPVTIIQTDVSLEKLCLLQCNGRITLIALSAGDAILQIFLIGENDFVTTWNAITGNLFIHTSAPVGDSSADTESEETAKKPKKKEHTPTNAKVKLMATAFFDGLD